MSISFSENHKFSLNQNFQTFKIFVLRKHARKQGQYSNGILHRGNQICSRETIKFIFTRVCFLIHNFGRNVCASVCFGVPSAFRHPNSLPSLDYGTSFRLFELIAVFWRRVATSPALESSCLRCPFPRSRCH